MKLRLRPKRSTAGFTLIELLVIIVIIGVMFAIAAPGWDALLSRQRVSTAREQVLQVIRQAQSEARSTRSYRAVVFDPNSPDGVPRVATLPFNRTGVYPININTVTNWRPLAGGSNSRNVISLRTNHPNNQIIFDGNGAVAQPPIVPANQFRPIPNSTELGFAVTVARANTSGNGTNRCVIIATLLGATRSAEGAACP
jgi:prepilin-type N-terminal cleavage/methylation domain-containing protein